MKAKLICIFLIFAMAFSGTIQNVRVYASDVETIYFPVRYGQTDARSMADKLNEYRTGNGKGELIYDYNLEKVAMQRAAEIVVRFNDEGENHYRPDGESYKTTIGDFGFDISPRGILYAENILTGTDGIMELDAAFDQFCVDAKNNEIMLGNFEIFGVAHIRMDDKTDFWVQVFASEGTPGTYTAPVDAVSTVSVRVNPAIVDNVKVDYSLGDHSVAVGNTVPVPAYIPKIIVKGSELKDPLTLSPLSFNSNDGFVSASGSVMTGLKEGTGTISAQLLGRSFSYNVTVTPGNGNTPTSVVTQPVTSAPSPTSTVTDAPKPTDEVVVWTPSTPTPEVATTAPTPTEQVVTWTPNPTQAVTTAPTQTVTTKPTQPVTTVPTQTITASPTETPVTTPKPTSAPAASLKKGDTFSEGNLKFKVTGKNTVEVIGLASKSATSVSIPETVKQSGVKYKVTKIASGAFSGKTKLNTVEIGSNVKTIGAKAFKGCKALTSITIPKNVKSIGKSAFYGCSKLKTVTFAGTVVKSIASKAFSKINSKAVITVPSDVYKSYKKLLDKSGVTCTVKKK